MISRKRNINKRKTNIRRKTKLKKKKFIRGGSQNQSIGSDTQGYINVTEEGAGEEGTAMPKALTSAEEIDRKIALGLEKGEQLPQTMEEKDSEFANELLSQIEERRKGRDISNRSNPDAGYLKWYEEPKSGTSNLEPYSAATYLDLDPYKNSKVRLGTENGEVNRLLKILKGLKLDGEQDWNQGIYKTDIDSIGTELYSTEDEINPYDSSKKITLHNLTKLFEEKMRSIRYIDNYTKTANDSKDFNHLFQVLLELVMIDDDGDGLCIKLGLDNNTEIEEAVYKNDSKNFKKLFETEQKIIYEDNISLFNKKNHLYDGYQKPLTQDDINGDDDSDSKLIGRYKQCYNLEQYYLIKHIELAEIVRKILNVTRNIYILLYIFNKISKLYDTNSRRPKNPDDIYLPKTRWEEIKTAYQN